MNFYGQAAQAAAEILEAFQNPNSLPEPLAQVFIRRRDEVPCRSWSWRNQLLVALHGSLDARGFRQWQEVGRWVRKGERAFPILAPIPRRLLDEATGEERTVVIGFRGVPVFGLEQTEGKPLPTGEPDAQRWVEALPLLDVARSWGLSVEAFDGEGAGCLGLYRRGRGIALGVKNLSTWAHELGHAADDRLGNLTEKGQHWRSETVAELGGAVLLRLVGFEEESDRICAAGALVLDTAEQISRQVEAQAAAEGAAGVGAWPHGSPAGVFVRVADNEVRASARPPLAGSLVCRCRPRPA